MSNLFSGPSNYRTINYRNRAASAAEEINAWDMDKDRYRRYRLEWKNAAEKDYVPSRPLHVDIELSDACNLRCRMCTHGMGNDPKGDLMAPALAKYNIDVCSRIGVYSIMLN